MPPGGYSFRPHDVVAVVVAAVVAVVAVATFAELFTDGFRVCVPSSLLLLLIA